MTKAGPAASEPVMWSRPGPSSANCTSVQGVELLSAAESTGKCRALVLNPGC